MHIKGKIEGEDGRCMQIKGKIEGEYGRYMHIKGKIEGEDGKYMHIKGKIEGEDLILKNNLIYFVLKMFQQFAFLNILGNTNFYFSTHHTVVYHS
jgi:hypothetical protein